MTSGDFWVRKKFSFFDEKTFSYILCTLFAWLLLFSGFICFPTYKAQDILYFRSFRGILKAFSSFIWKNSLFAVLFSGILMMIIPKQEKSFLCLIFLLSESRALLIFLPPCYQCLGIFFWQNKKNLRYFFLMYSSARSGSSPYTLLTRKKIKNLNKWFLIYVLRVLN